MDLEVPDEVKWLFRSTFYHGTSLELQVSRAHVRELWGTRSNAKGGVHLWRSRQTRAMTIVGRMKLCHSRELVVHALREAGKHFRSNSMASWRPYVLLALGLMGEPLDLLQAMDPLAVHRTWPVARSVAARLQQREEPAPADEEPAGAPAEPPGAPAGPAGAPAGPADAPAGQAGAPAEPPDDKDSDSDVLSVSSSSSSSSSHMDASSDKTESPEAAGSSSTWTGRGQKPSTTSARSASAGASGKSFAPAGRPKLAEQGRGASKPAEMIQNLLRMRYATPKRVLGLGPRAGAIDVRKQYMHIARMIHPDKCPLPDATAAFQIVSKAYEEAQRT